MKFMSIAQKFKNKAVIIRSSSNSEDQIGSSGAGEFLSLDLPFDWSERDLQISIKNNC